MATHTVHCPHCAKPVHTTRTAFPPHSGHANLPDGGKLVCLEVGEGCEGLICPVTGLPTLVMGVRLARSDLEPSEPWPHVQAECAGCGGVVEMEVLDHSHAFCPLCSTSNTLALLEREDGTFVEASSAAEGPTALGKRRPEES